MNIKTEAYGLQIGVNNSITEAMKTGNWGIRFSFTTDDNTGQFDTVITEESALDLIDDIKKSLKSISDCRKKLNKKPVLPYDYTFDLDLDL